MEVRFRCLNKERRTILSTILKESRPHMEVTNPCGSILTPLQIVALNVPDDLAVAFAQNLIKEGAKVDQRLDEKSDTALQIALSLNKKELALYLLKCGAIDQKNAFIEEPLVASQLI